MTTPDDSGTHATLAGQDDTSDSPDLPRGSNLGRYVIIEPIGSGGMGTVYRAYDPQLNRGVALKILSVKHADLQEAERAKARLIREAQALAQLSHPNVVAVHDAGTFEDDVYIAMELVEGKTLDDWLKEEKRAIKEILEVMTAAGRGLSAAHKAGLVHRDFKPGNVIVGDDGRVRVLDFGLARAADQAELSEDESTDSKLAPDKKDEQSQESKDTFDWKEISSDSSPNLLQSPLTQAGGIIGTPMYMAPEQHLGLKTDERTDQFGFCVVLYEVLYGKRPFVAGSIEKLKSKVIRQQVSIPSVDTEVPDWLWQIIRKGLSVKPEDRYPSIDSMVEELEQDPEEVRRQKRMARWRLLFAVSLILLVIALPIGVWYGLRYRTFQLCKDAEGEIAGVWDNTTKASVQKAFFGTKETYALGTWGRVERIVGSYVDDWTQMRSEVCEARLIRGTQSEELFDLRMSCLRKRIGEVRALVKVFSKADSQVVRKAVQASASLTNIAMCVDEKALQARYPSPKTEEAKIKVASIREKLADVVALNKTGKYQQCLALARMLEREANVVDYVPVQAEVLYQLGDILGQTGDYENAETVLLDAARASGDIKNALLTAEALAELAWVVGYKQARHKEAVGFAKSAEIMLRVAGGDNALRSQILNNLGAVLCNMGDYDEALLCYRKSLAIREKLLGPEHPEVAKTINNLGVLYYSMGEYNEALVYWDRSMAIQEKTLGAEHPDVALSLNNIGGVLNLMGEQDKAIIYHRRALTIREKALGPSHPDVAMSLNNIGEVLHGKGKLHDALDYHRRALVIWKKAVGTEHPLLARSLHYVGSVFYALGNYDNALEYYQESLAIREKMLGSDHPSLAESLSRIGSAFLDSGMRKLALKPFERVVSLCEKKSCHPGPHGQGLLGLAKALVATGRDKNRAIKLAIQAREMFAKTPKVSKKNIEDVDAWLQKHRAESLAKKAINENLR